MALKFVFVFLNLNVYISLFHTLESIFDVNSNIHTERSPNPSRQHNRSPKSVTEICFTQNVFKVIQIHSGDV